MFKDTPTGKTHHACQIRSEEMLMPGQSRCCECNPHLDCDYKKSKSAKCKNCTPVPGGWMRLDPQGRCEDCKRPMAVKNAAKVCSDCQYKEHHSPECKLPIGQIYNLARRTLDQVHATHYGTKNRVQLIQTLDKLIELIREV